MVIRTTPPSLQQLEKIKIIEAKKIALDNGIPVYSINAGVQDVAKLMFIFPAGDVYHPEGVIASASSHLIDDGTSTKSAAQIAETFDFYGASIECENDFHQGTITLYTLNKFLEPTLDLILEIIGSPAYSEAEVENYVNRNVQQLLVSDEKVDYLARKNFRAALFGNHPYGHTAEVEDYKKLNGSDLKKFASAHYNFANCQIIISGKVSDEQLNLLNKKIGSLSLSKKNEIKPESGLEKIAPQPLIKKRIAKENAVQAAIRIGKVMVTRTHPDYKKLLLLNTVLGGYFGSRLMSNIREDKGYTYGIGSTLVANPFAGNLVIGTEVGVNVCNNALEEIYKEIDILTKEPIPVEELAVVKNYITGSFLKSLDGPFELAQRFHTLLTFGLGYNYYYDYLEAIKNATSEELMVLAQKYFKQDSFTEIVVG
ncbi:MAG: pitrilysin family protein [Bacteroidia bacterium]